MECEEGEGERERERRKREERERERTSLLNMQRKFTNNTVMHTTHYNLPHPATNCCIPTPYTYLELMRYCAIPTASGVPVMVTRRS